MNEYTPTKKSLGQHWLHDEASLQAIVAAAHAGRGDTVLEIGPGLGTLTEVLLRTGAKVHATEYDESLIPSLTQKFKSYGEQFSIEHADILQFDFASLPAGYKVVANIPYYLTSNLLRVMCESPNPFSEASLLVQKEVAERVCAGPGDMSILAVSVQFYCHASLGVLVPASLFTPLPKVDSQVLILKFRSEPLFPDVDPDAFMRLVKAGFSEKRKMLRSSLSGGLHMPKPEVEEMLRKAGIEPTLRAQALSLDDWHELYKVRIRLS